MSKFKNQLGFLLAIFVCLAVVFACNKKDEEDTSDKKEDTKKETTTETTKETTKETTTNDERKSSGNYSGAKLYFCDEYTESGREVGVSDVFTIQRRGGYLVVMVELRPAKATVGTGKVELRIVRYEGSKEKIVETLPFDVQPDWDYIHFDEVTFYKDGDYKLTLLKSDGTPICSGEVTINYR